MTHARCIRHLPCWGIPFDLLLISPKPFRRKFPVKKILVVALSAMFLASSTPALAVAPTLPEGHLLFQVGCDNAVNDLQLLGVDLENEDLLTVGDGTGVNVTNDCASQGAMLPGTAWFYYIDRGGIADVLFRVDIITGETEEIGVMEDEGSWADLYSLAIGPNGNAYALSYDYLFGVNLDNGNLVQLNEPNVYDLNSGYPYGFAYDRVTKKFYIAEDGGYEIHQLNVSTGELTYVTENSDFWIGSFAFDANGDFWFNGDDSKIRRASLDNFDDSANVLATGDILLSTTEVYSESLGLALPDADDDSEGLAPTGSTDVSALAALAGLAGLAAVAIRRRATR
jgi:hypothetical protein